MDTSMCENKVSHRKGKIKKLDKDASFEELQDAAEDIPNKLWAVNNGIRIREKRLKHVYLLSHNTRIQKYNEI